MDGWTEEDVKRLVMEYVTRKPTIIERVIPAGLLFKLRRKYIQDELNRLLPSWINAVSKKHKEDNLQLIFLKTLFHTVTFTIDQVKPAFLTKPITPTNDAV
jgi:hypothetical protein